MNAKSTFAIIKIILAAITVLGLDTAIAVSNDVTPVTVLPFSEIAIYPVNDVPATVMSQNESTLSAEINGTIESIPVKVGDTIKKDALLVNINCADFELKYQIVDSEKQAMLADLEFTQWQLSRAKKLATHNNTSQEQVHQLEANVKKLQANLIAQDAAIQNAQNMINRCKVRTPYDAIVVDLLADIGEYAVPGANLVKVVDINNLEVEASLHVTELAQLLDAKGIKFVANGTNFDVKIRAVVQSQDPRSRTQIVRLTFAHDMPLPGAAGRLKWQSNLPAIPAEYVRQIGYQLGVFVAVGNTAKFIPLPNAIEGQPAIIENELSHKIIVDGRYAITDGSKLDIQKSGK